MIHNLLTNISSIKLLLIVICVSFAISCQSDEAALNADETAKQTINSSSQMLSSGQKPSAENFEKLKAVYEKYPKSETVAQTYKSALIVREDWAALEKFLSSIPKSELSNDDSLNLGKTYIKLGRYNDAIKTLKALENGNNLEVKTLLANAYFHLDRYAEAKPLLDNNWEQIIKDKRADDITMRGMIYFHEKENDKAIETLEKALEVKPDNIPAANGLSRVYAAKGDTEKAEEYLAKVQQMFDTLTAEERRKTNLVEKIYKLQEAYKAKRFQEVISLVNEVLPQADAKNKAALYQYLYNSYQALGMQKEAQETLAKAKQIQQ